MSRKVGNQYTHQKKKKKKKEDMNIVSKEKHANINGTSFSGRMQENRGGGGKNIETCFVYGSLISLLYGLIVRTSLAWEKYKPGITVSKNFVLRNREGLEGPGLLTYCH